MIVMAKKLQKKQERRKLRERTPKATMLLKAMMTPMLASFSARKRKRSQNKVELIKKNPAAMKKWL